MANWTTAIWCAVTLLSAVGHTAHRPVSDTSAQLTVAEDDPAESIGGGDHGSSGDSTLYWTNIGAVVEIVSSAGCEIRVMASSRILLTGNLADRAALHRWRPSFLTHKASETPVDLGIRPNPFAPQRYANRLALGIAMRSADSSFIPVFRYQQLTQLEQRADTAGPLWGNVEDTAFSLKGRDAQALQGLIGFPNGRIAGIQVFGFSPSQPTDGAVAVHMQLGTLREPAVYLAEFHSLGRGPGAVRCKSVGGLWRASAALLPSLVQKAAEEHSSGD